MEQDQVVRPAMSVEARARVARYIILGCAVAAWEIVPRAGLVPHLFLPSLSSSIAMLFGNAGLFGMNLLVTLKEVAISLIFACGGGILGGLWVGSSVTVRKRLLPVFSALFAVPLVILYPLFTAWFGIGSMSKIVFASVYGFLPTLLGAAAGVQTIDRQLTRVASSLGAGRLQQMLWVYLPATVPTILASFRLGGALVIVGVVVAEMMTATAGIGFLLSKFRTQLNSPGVYAAIILVLALAVLFDMGVQAIDRRWQRAGRPLKRGRGQAVQAVGA